MMKRFLRISTALCLVFTMQLLHAQDSTRTDKKDPRPLKDRLYYGGGVNLTFGTFTVIGASPRVGYKVDQKGKFSVGIGGDYNYRSFQGDALYQGFSTSVYGASLFSRYRVLDQIFLSAEFQTLSYEGQYLIGVTDDRAWIPFLYLGGGYSAKVGGNSYFFAQVAWDVIRDSRLFYNRQGLRGPGPVTNVGFGVGF